MLTSKNRAVLRSLANTIDTIIFIGKEDIGDNLIKQVDDALTARELVKGKVQENSLYTPKEAGEELAERTGSELVSTIGRKFILYRRNPEKPKIEL